MKRVNKKGLAVTTIVALIILILGFGILLFAFYQLNWYGNVDKKVCEQSVVYRATLPSFAGAKEYVPLKCKTAKICITTGSGSCREFENAKGVTKIKVRDVEDVEQAVAKEILSCWEMMGQGKLSMFSDWFVQTYGIGKMTSSCVICDRIAFDKASLEKAGIDLKKMNVMNYMQTHKVPEKDMSYYIYLTGSEGKMSIENNLQRSLSIGGVNSEAENPEEAVQIDFSDKSEDSSALGNELSVMFMQVQMPPGHWDSFKNSALTLGLALGGTNALAPKFVNKGMNAVLKSPWTWVILGVLAIYQQNSVAENQAFTVSKCGDVTVGSDNGKGCSVVRTINYNAEDISKYCTVIESIP